MSSLLTFIGHFHPVVVHLPIGMILAALLLQALAMRPAYAGLRPAVPVLLLMGVLAALLSCLTGYVLSSSGEYDASLVGWHMWMGIALTFLSLLLWSRMRRSGFDRGSFVLSLVVLGLVIVTGHLGGSLTHGTDYLSFGSSAGAAVEVDSPIVNVQQARAYREIVRPILRDNCYGCHGPTRQKGGLRMDDTAGLFHGGKDGVVLVRGQGASSELIKRLLLPLEDEHHMPPKDKKQLSSREVLLLHWWIDQGASTSSLVSELKQPDSVRPALLSVQGVKARVVAADGVVPSGDVPAADEKAVQALRARGVLVMPVAQGSHWLEAALGGRAPGGAVTGAAPGGAVTDPAAPGGTVTDGAAPGGTTPGGAVTDGATPGGAGSADVPRLLLGVGRQLVSLKASRSRLGDAALGVIDQCVALRFLDVSGDSISDAGLAALKELKELRVLNLVGTNVSAAGVAGLKGLPKLRTIYLYKTKVNGGDWAELKKVLPKVELDTGGYAMPFLETDTAIVRRTQ